MISICWGLEIEVYVFHFDAHDVVDFVVVDDVELSVVEDFF